MNIFYLSENIQECAAFHGDKHVLKMIIESAQMLSTAHWMLGNPDTNIRLYKKTHENHPCSVWVRQDFYHYQYLYGLFCCLLEEYKYRYGKTHKTSGLIKSLVLVPSSITKRCFSEPPQCMPDEFRRENTVEAYRAYYKQKYADGIVQYHNKRAIPEWLK